MIIIRIRTRIICWVDVRVRASVRVRDSLRVRAPRASARVREGFPIFWTTIAVLRCSGAGCGGGGGYYYFRIILVIC